MDENLQDLGKMSSLKTIEMEVKYKPPEGGAGIPCTHTIKKFQNVHSMLIYLEYVHLDR